MIFVFLMNKQFDQFLQQTIYENSIKSPLYRKHIRLNEEEKNMEAIYLYNKLGNKTGQIFFYHSKRSQ